MDKILKELEKLKEDGYRKFNQKLCPDTKQEMLGIRVPILRKLAQDIVKNKEYEWEEFVLNENIKYFEEILLQGLIIGYSKIELDEKIKYLKYIIPRMDSWVMTDTVIPTLKIKKVELEKYWNFILTYINSEKEFEVRFCIVSMLDYFLIDEYIDRVIKILNEINHEGYYVKMAVAWTLAEAGIKYNSKTMKFLKGNNNLDKFTYNKTLQKMIESFRISEKDKELLKKMKRKD